MSKEEHHVDSDIGTARLIILGAGRPYRGKRHVALRGTPGQGRILDWLIHAVSSLDPDIYFVGGYQVEEVARRYPAFNYVVNPKWEETGAVASLLEAPLDHRVSQYVTYADIVFHDDVIAEMESVESDIVVASDSRWRNRYAGRTDQDLERCEKISVHDGSVTRLGVDIDPDLADNEFIGLVRFSPKVVDYLTKNLEPIVGKLRRAKLSELIEHLRTRGFFVHHVDVRGDWAELNESRDLAHFVLGTKAQTLRRLQRLVKKSQIEDQVSFTVSEWANQRAGILSRIADAFSKTKVVVRSSALSEDGFSSANAGAYTSVLGVATDKVSELRQAIGSVVDSYPDGNPANEVLVQPMVKDVRASGVTFTRTLAHGAPYYVINYDDTTRSTESITSGSSKEHKTLVVYRNALGDKRKIPKAVQDLPEAILEIEELLGYDSLDIEFAINEDGVVHVLQVRPIAVDHEKWEVSDSDVAAFIETAKERFRAMQIASPFCVGDRALFGIMPDWNPAEIIGTKPGRLAIGLYRYLIMDEVWATQRAQYGYRDVRPQPLLVGFAGHPYVDVRASFNSFVPATIDDELANRLVNFYLDWLVDNPHLHDKVEFDVVPTCFGLNFEKWGDRLKEAGGFSRQEVADLREGLKDITRKAFKRNAEDLASVDELEARFKRVISTDMPKLEKAILLLEECRRYGTLPFAHLARSAFIAVTLLKTAVEKEVVSKAAMESFLNSINTITNHFTRDARLAANGELSFEEFVDRYGHLRPGTYDVTSPSYQEDPEHYLRPIVDRARSPQSERHSLGAWEKERAAFGTALSDVGLSDDLEQVEGFMRQAIEGREYAKFAFTRNLSSAIDCLVSFGRDNGLDRKALSNVPLDAFFGLRTGSVLTTNVAEWLQSRAYAGHRLRHMARVVELPPLLLEESDIEVFSYPASQANFIGSSRITADCIDLTDKSAEASGGLSGKIAMIPQADPGYDWLFGQEIAGLITMYGGANSHMAIRSAEFGLPAAIGVGETKFMELSIAHVLELDAQNRRIQVVR